MALRSFAADEGWRRVPGEEGEEPPQELPPLKGTTEDLVPYLLREVELLEDILQELREQVQQGVVYPITFPIPPGPPIDVLFDPPLFSMSLTNDGPGVVQYRIPNQSSAQWVALNPAEVIIVNFIKGLIPAAGFRVPVGLANVRIVGTY